MAGHLQVLKFVDVLRTDPCGLAIISQLLDCHELKLVPSRAIYELASNAADEWLLTPFLDSGDAAVGCVRSVAGWMQGFPRIDAGADGNLVGLGPTRRLDSSSLSPTHFVIQDFDTVRTYHLNLSRLMPASTCWHESCSPAEFTTEISKVLAEVQRRTLDGENFVHPAAQLGSPGGVVWSTPDIVCAADMSAAGTPVANKLRNRLGLVDSHWDNGGGLFQYSIDTAYLDDVFRGTPIEGGNRRFRLQPCRPKEFAPFGATVDLELLVESLKDGGRAPDDGAAECVSKPFQPVSALWDQLIRDLQFTGAMSHEEDLAASDDQAFTNRVLRGVAPAARVAAFVNLLETSRSHIDDSQ